MTKFERTGKSLANDVAMRTNDYLSQEAFANFFGCHDQEIFDFHAPTIACGSDWAHEALPVDVRIRHNAFAVGDTGLPYSAEFL